MTTKKSNEQQNKALIINDDKIIIRQRVESDIPKLLEMFNSLGSKTKYMRFAKGVPPEMEETPFRKIINKQNKSGNVFSLVAEVKSGQDTKFVAESMYIITTSPFEADIAIVVQDDFQRNGLGLKILKEMSKKAIDNGLTYFRGEILSDNKAMIGLIRKTGYKVIFEQDIYLVNFRMDLSQVEVYDL